MLRCVNGHSNPESSLFCATCLATMPPVEHLSAVDRPAQREAEPPAINWHSDSYRPAATGPETLDDVFGTGDEAAALETVGAPQRRRKRRSHRRWLPSLPHRSHHDRDVA